MIPSQSELIGFFYGICGLFIIVFVIGIIKAVDWLIGNKYVTNLQCEKCRSEIYKMIATDHDLLRNLDTKMDLILDNFEIKPKC